MMNRRVNGIILQKPTTRSFSRARGLKHWTSIFSNLSQIALLAVVTVGYFTSVRPLAQKELLAEQVASIELERQRIQKEVDELLGERELLLARANYLTDAIEKNKVQLKNYETSLKLAARELNEKESEVQKVQNKLATLTDDIISAEQSFEDYIRASLLGETEVPFEISEMLRAHRAESPFLETSIEDLSNALRLQWPNVDNLIQGRIRQIREMVNSQENNRLRSAWGTVLEQFIERTSEWKGSLLCPKPNFQLWEDQFKESVALVESSVGECMETLWNKLQDERDWSDSEVAALRNSEFWKEQNSIFSHTCQVSSDFLVIEEFSDQWDSALRQCTTVIRSIGRIGLRGEEPSIDDDDWDLEPPSLDLIKSKIDEVAGGLKF